MKAIFSAILDRLMWYCFSYTLGVISLSIWGIVRGGTKAQFSGLILLNIALVLIAVQVIDAVCARFIHKLVPFLIVDCVVITASLTAFYIAIGWISFNFWSITCCAATIAVTFGIVYAYVFKKNKADSQEINRKLKIQNEQNGIK